MDSYSRKYKVAATLIEQGYLIHCTNDDFKEFSPNFIKGGFRAREGYGFYFSDMPYKSIEYGDNIKIIRKTDFNFLEAKDKVDMSMFQPSEETIRNLNFARNQLDSARNVRDYDYFSNLVDELENELKGYDETLMYYVRKALSETSEQTYGALEYHIMNPKAMTPKLAQVYVKNGYDGYHYDGIYTVFNFDKLNKNVISLTDEDIEKLLATNESKTKGRTIIISEEQAKYIEDGLKNGFKKRNNNKTK